MTFGDARESYRRGRRLAVPSSSPGEKGCWKMLRLETVALVLATMGCHASAVGDTSPKEPVAPTPSQAPLPARSPDHALARSTLREVVSHGLGAFLQHVDIDDRPVFVAGRFHGFAIARLSDPAFFAGADIRPGDVVVNVNGLPIERPEQAQAAFDSLAKANELRVLVERDGQPRELVYPIIDDK